MRVSRRSLVNRPREEFLSRPALADEQDGLGTGGDLIDKGRQPHERRTGADKCAFHVIVTGGSTRSFRRRAGYRQDLLKLGRRDTLQGAMQGNTPFMTGGVQQRCGNSDIHNNVWSSRTSRYTDRRTRDTPV
jgi:hypothetical protein